MKNYIQHDPWCIIEEGFRPKYNRISESLCSIGNGRFGQRANFEEFYSGDTLQGSYVAGVYYPDKTRVGWWKNGYPEYFAKVLNSTNWIGINVELDGEKLDLARCEIEQFQRVLNMKEGFLQRTLTAKTTGGKRFRLDSIRFCSIVDDKIGAIRYAITPLNFSGKIQFTPYLDADVENEDSNYEEKFWIPIEEKANNQSAFVTVETKKTAFQVCTGMSFDLFKNGEKQDLNSNTLQRDKYAECVVEVNAKDEDEVVLYKYAAIISSMNCEKDDLMQTCASSLKQAHEKGFDPLKEEQKKAWAAKWEESDIVIEGDVAAQQGIRFNIYHMNQTYTGEDERLNIGPKGFTGEKYGGSTYWDTEAYCLPFYLSTADQKVARNLLVYRYKHLQKAIENAEKLGFKDGAALYPMVTINGEECHNEWEITFEEIHRNGAIAFAIYNYIRYTGDKAYIGEYGLEVLLGIARFWAQRVHFSARKQQYVMHGVTGPNEYENNVNNNWYTNYIAIWCLKYALEAIQQVRSEDESRLNAIFDKIKFYEHTETNRWKDIIDKMFYPVDEELGIFLQQDGFMDKEQILVSDLPEEDRPLNQKWSWDRILRSCFIKQADVLQGFYFFEDHFDEASHRRNFEFYEPRTVHESSLSPCVHAILAAKLGMEEKAYEMYLRTSRLDLDDYNNDTEDGLHITSMAGTWMAVVQGFGGMRVKDGALYFNPMLPKGWTSFSFRIRFRGAILSVKVDKNGTTIDNHSDIQVPVYINEESIL